MEIHKTIDILGFVFLLKIVWRKYCREIREGYYFTASVVVPKIGIHVVTVSLEIHKIEHIHLYMYTYIY